MEGGGRKGEVGGHSLPLPVSPSQPVPEAHPQGTGDRAPQTATRPPTTALGWQPSVSAEPEPHAGRPLGEQSWQPGRLSLALWGDRDRKFLNSWELACHHGREHKFRWRWARSHGGGLRPAGPPPRFPSTGDIHPSTLVPHPCPLPLPPAHHGPVALSVFIDLGTTRGGWRAMTQAGPPQSAKHRTACRRKCPRSLLGS